MLVSENQKFHSLPRYFVRPDDSKLRSSRDYRESKPKSWYDNFSTRPTVHTFGLVPETANLTTMESNVNTTVPQNISNKAVSNRHKPTRSSLRHSRMIVQNRAHGANSTHQKQMHTRLMVVIWLEIIFGIIIGILVTWLFTTFPKSLHHTIPLWSFLPLIISGISALIHQYYFNDYKPLSTSIFKFTSLLFSMISSVLCIMAASYLAIHFLSVVTSTCSSIETSSLALNETRLQTELPKIVCKCIYGHNETINFPSIDITCDSIKTTLSVLSASLIMYNILACIVSILFLQLNHRIDIESVQFLEVSTVII